MWWGIRDMAFFCLLSVWSAIPFSLILTEIVLWQWTMGYVQGGKMGCTTCRASFWKDSKHGGASIAEWRHVHSAVRVTIIPHQWAAVHTEPALAPLWRLGAPLYQGDMPAQVIHKAKTACLGSLNRTVFSTSRGPCASSVRIPKEKTLSEEILAEVVNTESTAGEKNVTLEDTLKPSFSLF